MSVADFPLFQPHRIAGGARHVVWHPSSASIVYAIRNHVVVETLSNTSQSSSLPVRERVMATHRSPISAIAVSGNGDLVAVASEMDMCVYDLRAFNERSASAEKGGVEQVSVTRSIVWRVASSQHGGAFERVKCLSFDPTGRRIVGVRSDRGGRHVRVWDAPTGSVTKLLVCPSPITTRAVWSQTSIVVATTEPASLSFWRVSDWSAYVAELPQWLVPAGVQVTELSSPPASFASDVSEEQFVVVGCSDGRVSVLRVSIRDADTDESSNAVVASVDVLKSWYAFESKRAVLHLSWGVPTKRNGWFQLIVGGDHDTLSMFGAKCSSSSSSPRRGDASPTRESRSHVEIKSESKIQIDGSPIESMTFGNAGQEGVLATRSGTIWYVNCQSRSIVRMRGGHTTTVTSLVASSTGAFVATIVSDGALSIWEGDGLRQIVEMRCRFALGDDSSGSSKRRDFASCLAVAMSKNSDADSQWLAASFDDGQVRLVDLATMKVKRRSMPFKDFEGESRAPASRLTFVDVSKDITALVACTDDCRIAVLTLTEDVDTLRWVHVAAPRRGIFASRYSNDVGVLTLCATECQFRDPPLFALSAHSKTKGTSVVVWKCAPSSSSLSASNTISANVLAIVDVEETLATKGGVAPASVAFVPGCSTKLLLARSTDQGLRIVVYSLAGNCIMGSFVHPFGKVPLFATQISVPVVSAAFSSDATSTDDVAVVSCTSGRMLLVDCDSGSVVEEAIVPHVASACAVAVVSGNDGRRLYAGSEGGLLCAWQL
eukprot:g3433.t1